MIKMLMLAILFGLNSSFAGFGAGFGAQTTNVTGTWDFQVETGQGSGAPVFNLKQEGEKLTGDYKGTFGEAPVTGTVKGAKIEFSFKVTGDISATIAYTSTIEGDSMKGSVKLGDLGEGTWTAKKRK